MLKRIFCIIIFTMSIFVLSCGKEETIDPNKPFSGKTITVLYMSSVYADAARDIVEEFEEKTGATVNVVDFPYVTLHEKALLDLTSQTGSFDVISVASQWDGEFAPYMTELTPYIEKENYDMKAFIENVLANAGEWQGEIYGIPHNNTPQVFAYRTDLIPEGLPDTWEEYLDIVKKNTDKSKNIYGATISLAPGQLGGAFYYILWTMGGAWADENWNVTIDSDETRAALMHMKEMMSYIDPASLSWGIDESTKAFLDGRAAICETWPSLGVVQDGNDPEKSKIAGKWGLSSIPKEKTGITLLSAWDVSIPDASKEKDLAWEWIKMYSSIEKANQFYDEFNILSPRKEFWEQPKIKDSSIYALREPLDTANMWWRIPASVESDTMFNTVISAYLSDQIDLETAIMQMDKGLKTALKNNPPEQGVKNYNR